MFVDVSARNGTNIDELLEAVTLTADVLELTANPNKEARGVAIEANLDKSAVRFPPSWFSPVPCTSVTLSLPVLLTVAFVQCSMRTVRL